MIIATNKCIVAKRSSTNHVNTYKDDGGSRLTKLHTKNLWPSRCKDSEVWNVLTKCPRGLWKALKRYVI